MEEREYTNLDETGYWGNTVADVYDAMQRCKANGLYTYCEFNQQYLNCDMTLDECYMKVTGKTKEEFDNHLRERALKAKKERMEHEEKIPQLIKEWKAWGKKNIPFLKRRK